MAKKKTKKKAINKGQSNSKVVKKRIGKKATKKVATKEPVATTANEVFSKELPNLVPVGKNKGGRKSQLELILTHNAGQYKKMLALIRIGCYMHVVAASMGIEHATFGNWLRQGKVDKAEEKATIYSRFFTDVYKATAQARLGMEMKLAEISRIKGDTGLLKHWLAVGPGRLLGAEWQEKNNLEVTLNSLPEDLEPEEEYLDLNSAPVDNNTMAGALTALEDLGLIQRTDRSGGMFLKQPSTNGKETK